MMKISSQNRKVLFIESEQDLRSLTNVLLRKLGCECEVVSSGQQALSMLGQENVDAVILDLRSTGARPDEVVSGIHELRPSLVGRVLVISGEVDDHETLDLIEHYFLLKIPRNRLMNDLVGLLRALLCIPPPRIHLEADIRRAGN